MQRKWKRGDRVTVVTLNRGVPRSSELRGRKGTDKTEAWAGEIVGPSLVGPGWWNVKRDTPSGEKHGTAVYAVPDGEIMPRD
jgi:hypothetical protein